MRTVSYQSLIDGALKLRGENPDNAGIPARLSYAEFLNVALSDCHEYWKWPELELTEQRYFRVTWTATIFNSGDEVWDPTTQAYYRANATTAGTDLPGTSTKWDLLTLFNRYIDYTQTGQTPIEAVLEAFDQDPRSTPTAVRLYFALDHDGVRFAADAPNSVWIRFRVRCPDYSWTEEWAAGTDYPIDSIVYHVATGEVYVANAETLAEVPGVSGKWTLVEVPYIFRHAAKLKAHALWCAANGDPETSVLFDNNDPANPGKFQNALDEQVWQYTKLQGQTGRVNTLVPRR